MSEATSTVEPLVESVKHMDRAYAKWESSDSDEFPRYLWDAVNVVCTMVTTGFPRNDDLISLFQSCMTLANEWQKVLAGEIHRDGKPLDSFFTAMRGVREQLDAAENPADLAVRRVADLLKEYGTSPLRWTWVAREFGEYDADTDRWSGVFFGRAGQVLQHKIEEEARNPGSVLPEDFTPPSIQKRRELAKAEAAARLAQLQAGLSRDEPKEDPETIESLLKEGQYPDVVARVKKVSLDEVLKVATTLGITVRNREMDLEAAALNSLNDPKREAILEGMSSTPRPAESIPGDSEPPSSDESEVDYEDVYDLEEASEPQQVESRKIAGAELDEWLAKNVEDPIGMNRHELMASIAESGFRVTTQAVTAAIGRIKEAQYAGPST